MDVAAKIRSAQKLMEEHHLDGWLIYDFHKSNELLYEFLELSSPIHLTRRFFYWIPVQGEPVQLIHSLESHVMDHLPGEKLIYTTWQNLQKSLENILDRPTVIAMEYSPLGMNPAISKVDAGTFELVKACNVEIVSSAPFLQYFTCVWSPYQYDLHKQAAQFLETLIQEAFSQVRLAIEEKREIDEYCLQQWMLRQMEKNQFITEGAPIVAVNQNSSKPHYLPTKDSTACIQKGDFILIDAWCKKNVEGSVFADQCRVAVVGVEPTKKQQEIFSIVKQAQKEAFTFIQKRFKNHQIVKGFEVDEICRKVISEQGYAEYFFHRTGHNLHIHNHGPGANLDSLEVVDDRSLIPRTCFTIEPGIYLGDFGIRLEDDVYISETGDVEMTSRPQESIQRI